MNDTRIPARSERKKEDCWNLSSLFPGEEAWEEAFRKLEAAIPRMGEFKGTLHQGPGRVKAALDFFMETDLLREHLGSYAHLRTTEDVADGGSQERLGRYMSLSTRLDALSSWFDPELQSLSDKKISELLQSEGLAGYRIYLEKVLRFKPHILSEEGEKILALGQESRGALRQAFSALTNADLNFGTLDTPEGPRPLTQSTYSVFLQSPDRNLRRRAYDQFYKQFDSHKNTLASLFAGSIQQDLFKARARGYPSCRAMALFPDKVPEEVYDNLVSTIRAHLPLLHRYYSLRKRILGLDKLHHSDVYAPLVPQAEMLHSYDQAVEVITQSLSPLGEEYTSVLKKGLLGGWVDRYENKGKRSGAFSSGAYGCDPVILMNYKEDNLRDVFTLAHEGGHSMHSWYSQRSNPFQHYSYTIFEAEVASTFNEQLLARHMLGRTKDTKLKAYLLSKNLEDMVATIFRQTMFAEFEHLVHKAAEEGQASTLESFRSIYRKLLVDYFGPEVELSPESDLEALRIPHFYGAFYVYKYATGLAAAITLSSRVLAGMAGAREGYLDFLKSGGSRYPLESLKAAGVDMARPEPVIRAMEVFSQGLDELEALLRPVQSPS